DADAEDAQNAQHRQHEQYGQKRRHRGNMIPPTTAFTTASLGRATVSAAMPVRWRPARMTPLRLRAVGADLVIPRQGRADVRVAGARIGRARHVDRGNIVADAVQILDRAGALRPADIASDSAA